MGVVGQDGGEGEQAGAGGDGGQGGRGEAQGQWGDGEGQALKLRQVLHLELLLKVQEANTEHLVTAYSCKTRSHFSFCAESNEESIWTDILSKSAAVWLFFKNRKSPHKQTANKIYAGILLRETHPDD